MEKRFLPSVEMTSKQVFQSSQIESIKKPVIANPKGEAISPFRRNNEIATSLPCLPAGRAPRKDVPKVVFQSSQIVKLAISISNFDLLFNLQC